MTVPVVFAIAGMIGLFLAIWGGGIKAKEIEVSPAPPKVRLIVGLVGSVFLGISVWLSTPALSGSQQAAPISQTPLQEGGEAVNTAIPTIDTGTVSPVASTIPFTQVAPQEATTFVVLANQDWQDTGITIRKDDKVTITYLSGTWSNCPANGCPYVDAAGVHELEGCINCPDNVLPSCSHAALIAKINDLTYCVGNSLTFLAFAQADDESGLLQLRINDKNLADNDGNISVSIILE